MDWQSNIYCLFDASLRLMLVCSDCCLLAVLQLDRTKSKLHSRSVTFKAVLRPSFGPMPCQAWRDCGAQTNAEHPELRGPNMVESPQLGCTSA